MRTPGGVDGSNVLVVAGAEPPSRGHGVLAISTVDGSSRWLVKPQAYDPDRPVRVLAASGSGERFATQLCRAGMESAYDCLPLEIRRVSDGTVVRRIDTAGRPIRLLGADWLVVGEEGVTAVVDLKGSSLWSNRDHGEGAWFHEMALLGGRLIAEVSGFGGADVRRLVAFDILSGEAEILYDPSPQVGWWWFLRNLSTDRYAVIREDRDEPDRATVFDAGVPDLETGTFDADAIYVDLTR